eukprot:scaffold224891_cov36-Tisochrysis_lutea.AAC.7
MKCCTSHNVLESSYAKSSRILHKQGGRSEWGAEWCLSERRKRSHVNAKAQGLAQAPTGETHEYVTGSMLGISPPRRRHEVMIRTECSTTPMAC